MVICDCTTLTQAGYVGDDIESVIIKLLHVSVCVCVCVWGGGGGGVAWVEVCVWVDVCGGCMHGWRGVVCTYTCTCM